MWVEILIRCCTLLVLYKLLCGEVDVNCPHSNACFAVASRLEKLYGGKCFVGLRIPDPDSVTRQHIDLVLVTEKEMIVVAVRNSSGYIEVGTDGNWTCTNQNICATKTFPDPVMEISSQMMILQSYLEQRGASLPKGHITGRVIFPNPNCMVSRS
ncbi:hypothetical protein LUZ60_014268 [Juncus effusus]|nr:hypothetical protein LUZ60_014268 [Juncus effusus]